jgi:hypothetical protein
MRYFDDAMTASVEAAVGCKVQHKWCSIYSIINKQQHYHPSYTVAQPLQIQNKKD